MPADTTLTCRDCGQRFIFTSGEQELFRLRGITSAPTQCPNCARGRVLASHNPVSTNHNGR